MEPTGQNPPEPETPPPAPGQPPRGFARVRIQMNARSPWVTYVLMGVCIVLYLLQMGSESMFGVDVLSAWGAKVNSAIIAGQYWRLLTPALLHVTVTHILFNMYALYIIGRNVELPYGHGRYFLLFWLSAFAGNVFSFLFSASNSAGASTAIFGIIAAEGVFIYRNRKFFPNARAMLTNILVVIGINLALGLTPGIDNWGHLGGLLGGLVFAWIAGATWHIRPGQDGFVLSDEGGQTRTLQGALAVLLLFGAPLALQLFLLR